MNGSGSEEKNPKPSEGTDSKVHGFQDTIDWYDNNSEQYAESLNEVVPMDSIGVFLKVLPPHPSVLEAGCGPGRESKIFHEKGVHTIGVDLSEGLLKVAKERNPEVEYVKADFRELPFQDGMFDGVWSHASLVHLETIEDVKKSIDEFRRVLKSGGILFIKVKAQTGEKKTDVVTDTLSKHDRFFRYYTVEELKEILMSNGFEILSTDLMEDGHGRAEVKWIQIVGKKKP